MRTTTHYTLSNIVRSLHVLLLALLGLAFYAAVFLLLAGLCFLVFSASVHAQEPAGSWTTVGSMSVPRHGHTATLLPNGKVLVVGGYTSGMTVTDQTELYDPATRKWAPAARLERATHTATLLTDGKVLVAGGAAPAMLYDPASDSWRSTGPMNDNRVEASAIRLSDGRVLVVGGYDDDDSYVTELYDPQTGTWSVAGKLQQPWIVPRLTLLDDGKVLASGGTSAGLFDPSTQTWTATGDLPNGLQPDTATLLRDGRVLVNGGIDASGSYATSGAIYDPQANSWSVAPGLQTGRRFSTATLLVSGYVLVAGGEVLSGQQSNLSVSFLASTELYDGARWMSAGNLNVLRAAHTATLLASGEVLVAGGANGDGSTELASAEIFTPPGLIDAGFTGSWFDPSQSGHGLMLEVLPGNQVLALWFAFDPSGTQQSWFGGVGTYSGNTAIISNAVLPTGGRWGPSFNENAIVANTWGTLSFTFSDHDHGKVTFNSTDGYGAGSMDLTRLTSIAPQTRPAAVASPIGPPVAVVADASGNAYFSSNPDQIFRVDSQGGLAHIAGNGTPGYSGDGGPATLAQLNFPLSYPELVSDPIDFSPLVGGLALDAANNLYIADAYNNRVRRIDTNGIITTAVDNAGSGSKWPQGVAVDPAGNLYFSTAFGTLVRKAANGTLTRVASSNCGPGYLGPGVCVPEQIAFDVSGNLFVPDGYCRVRELRTDGTMVTVAGADSVPSNGSAFTCGYSGDGGPATRAALAFPYAVAVDAANNLYIADTGNNCIRKVNSTGIIATVAGSCGTGASHAGYSGDGGLATSASLNSPYGIAVDAAGNLYIADTNNNRVRKVSTNGIITTIAGNGGALATPTPGAITAALTGNWFNPAQSGHGLMLEVLPGNQLLVYWFAFNPSGTEQSWFGGIGSYSGNKATIDMALPTGGRWIPNFDENAIVKHAWGSLTLTFTDCNHGHVDFSSIDGYGSGSMDLSRLTLPLGLACP